MAAEPRNRSRVFSKSSYVDIATNFAHLDGVEFESDFADFWNGDFRVKHLLTLLHETTHHWCLMTYLGTALAAYASRAYQRTGLLAASIESGRSDLAASLQENFHSDILASRTLTAFLVPLLEGLATYAEWRATPLGEATYSRPFDIYGRFAGPSVDPEAMERLARDTAEMSPAQVEAHFKEWFGTSEAAGLAARQVFETSTGLRLLRSHPEERERFERVLSTPIDPGAGSYQLGYLFVCGLERICWGHRNTDMFLAFLREYFFNDLDLASALLDGDQRFPTVYRELRNRLQAKVWALVGRPAEAKDLFDRWAEKVPFAPVVKHEAKDFLGMSARGGTSDEDPQRWGEARSLFESRLSAFLGAIEFEIIPNEVLNGFLQYGRVLMPLGSKDFTAQRLEAGRLILQTAEGQELDLDASRLETVPTLGVTVSVGMLVNVASPGIAVSLRWSDGFEVMPRGNDPISAAMIKSFYSQAGVIAEILTAGQDVLPRLRMVTAEGSERADAAANELEDSEEMARHILEIYRAPILVAFTEEVPEVLDVAWRDAAFERWQPNGIRSLLATPDGLRAFLRVSGASFIKVRPDVGLGTTSPTELADLLFEKLNSLSRTEYDCIVEQLDATLRREGIRLFAETDGGSLVSLV